MPAQSDHDDVFEYRIVYVNTTHGYLSRKHFLAHSQQHALEIFRYACQRKSIEAEVVSIDFWNRWANRWEKQELIVQDPEPSIAATRSA
jgi:hypothetical protein